MPEEENEIVEEGEEEEEVFIKFKLFESYPRYGMLKNLLFDDDTKSFGEIEPGENYRQYLQNSMEHRIHQPVSNHGIVSTTGTHFSLRNNSHFCNVFMFM